MEGTQELKLIYSKNSVSELAIRKALYWISEACKWSLNDKSDSWEVNLEADAEDEVVIKAKFERLLNDYILRESLDSKTLSLKQSIIRKSLKDLANAR
jgi:His-Xaa-Ser system protein HxsD